MRSAGSSKRRAPAADRSGGPTGVKEYTLCTPSRTDHLERIRTFVSEASRRAGFGEEDVNKIELAVDEACSNVITHAYGRDEGQDLHVAVRTDAAKLTVVVTDHGKSFDFQGLRMPDMKQYLAELRVGGLGIYLMKMLMDEVEYRSEPGRNELIMTKYRVPAKRPAE
jgi:serine/threonine-protein kinase RsbW